MSAAPPPPTVVRLASYGFWGEDHLEVSRHFGRRHDPEPVQPLIRLAYVQRDGGERKEYWLSRGEAQALAHALLTACIPPSKEAQP